MARIGTPTVLGNYVRDEFIGDDNTTSFQLSAKPGSVNSIIVHVGNVYQHGSYTVFEDWITFDDPIPNGTVVHTNILGKELQINHPADGSVDENSFQTERNPQIREALELVKQSSPTDTTAGRLPVLFDGGGGVGQILASLLGGTLPTSTFPAGTLIGCAIDTVTTEASRSASYQGFTNTNYTPNKSDSTIVLVGFTSYRIIRSEETSAIRGGYRWFLGAIGDSNPIGAADHPVEVEVMTTASSQATPSFAGSASIVETHSPGTTSQQNYRLAHFVNTPNTTITSSHNNSTTVVLILEFAP